jgi:site-specific DNA recombinase
MRITAIYARVSSSKQREEKTIDSQISALKKYAEEQGVTIPPEYIFKDEGYSGSVLVRPGLEHLRDLAAEGQIEVILVYSPDRLSRKYAYQVLLLEEFGRCGVEVVFLKCPKANTPEEELLLQFQGMIAEYERAQIAERSRRGKRHRAKCGLVNVLSGAPYGYRYIKKTDYSAASYEVVEKEAEVVREVYRLFTGGSISIGGIARHLNQEGIATRKGQSRWERSTVWGILKNPAYKGTACYGKTETAQRQRITRPLRQRGGFSPRCSSSRDRQREEWIEIPVPAIISDDTFECAHELLEKNRQLSRRNTKSPTLLQGLMVCSECGYSLYKCSTRTSKRKIYYYRCFGSDDYRFEHGRICKNRPIRQDYLDELVWQHVIGLLENPVLIGEEIERRHQEALNSRSTQRRRDTLLKEATHVRNGMNKLLDGYQEGLIELEELRKRMPELRKREQVLNSQLQSLDVTALEQSHWLELSLKVEDFLKCLRHSAKSLSVLDRQKVIRLIIKEVLVGMDKITIKHSIPITGRGGGAGLGASGPEEKKSYQLCTWSNIPAVEQHLPTRSVGQMVCGDSAKENQRAQHYGTIRR